MNIPDVLERLFWTVLAAFLGGLTVGGVLDISTIDAAIVAGASAGVNFLLLVARSRLAVLPEPGDGLPGLPVDDGVDVARRLLPYDPEHTTDGGAVDLATINAVCLVIIAVVAVLYAFGKLPL